MFIRILSSIIIFLFFIFVIFFTFFQESRDIESIDISFPWGVWEIYLNEDKGAWGKSFSLFETLYTPSRDTELTDLYDDATTSIKLSQSQWEFVSSLRDLRKKYYFITDGLIATQSWPGEVYFRREETGEILLFPLNTSLDLKLVSSQGETYTSMYLYPHMYLRFHPLKWKFLKNADRVRIETVYELWFVGDIRDIEELPDPNIRLGEKLILQSSFLREVQSYILQVQDISEQKLADMLEARIFSLRGMSMIQDYMTIFLNEEKKLIYYQNQALASFLKRIRSDSYDTTLILAGERDEKILKKYSDEWYQQLKEVQDTLLAHIFMSPDKDMINSKLNFLGEATANGKSFFPLYTYSLFKTYHNTSVLQQEILKKYFDAFQIWSLDMPPLARDYFLFFLEAQITHHLSGEYTTENFDYIRLLLWEYFEISSELYAQDKKSRITALFIYETILREVSLYLRKNFFEVKRDGQILLLSSDVQMDSQGLSDMKKFFQDITLFFEENKSFLNKNQWRDAEIYNGFLELQKSYEEYLDALTNYESYKSKYDTSRKNLLDFNVDGEDQGIQLSREDFFAYMNNFKGLSFSWTSVEIIDNRYYQVKNMQVFGRKISFDLYPSSLYTIKNIYIDQQRRPQEYKLDLIEQEWDNNFKIAAPSEKDQYDFSRFFLISLLWQTVAKNSVEVLDDVGVKSAEDKTEIVFKRSKLLWEGSELWEFESLQNFLNIEYEDIFLERQGDEYRVFLEEVDFSLQAPNSRKIFSWVLRSEYNLKSSSRSFQDMEIQFYVDKKNISRGYLLKGIRVSLVSIKKQDLAWVIGKIIEDIPDIENILVYLDRSSYEEEKIVFIPWLGVYKYDFIDEQNKKVSLSFDRVSKTFTLVIDGKKYSGVTFDTLKKYLF